MWEGMKNGGMQVNSFLLCLFSVERKPCFPFPLVTSDPEMMRDWRRRACGENKGLRVSSPSLFSETTHRQIRIHAVSKTFSIIHAMPSQGTDSTQKEGSSSNSRVFYKREKAECTLTLGDMLPL